MNDTKFTPGPWWAAIGSDQPSPMYRGTVAIISTSPEVSVVTGTHGDQSGHTALPAEWEANGRLIAAAPDLYAALAEIVEAVNANEGSQEEEHRVWSAVQDAGDVLAKARGEAIEDDTPVAQPDMGNPITEQHQ